MFSIDLNAQALESKQYYEGGRKHIVHKGERADYSDIQMTGRLIEVPRQWILRDRVWSEIVCDYKPSIEEIKKHWAGYYQWGVGRTAKINALAGAIQGFNREIATAVADFGIFDGRPPSSWNEFKSAIERAEGALRIYGLYQTVIEINGQRNYEGLGYRAPDPVSAQPESNLWDNFYQAPKSSKAEAFKKMIKGTTLTDAKIILFSDYGEAYPTILREKYFVRKPESWEAFKAEIERIDHDLDLASEYEKQHGQSWSLFKRAISNNGSINKRNLYETESNIPPIQYECEFKNVTGKRYIIEEGQPRVVREYNQKLNVVVSGSNLLPSETETFILLYNPQYASGEDISVDISATLNNYSVERDNKNILLKSKGRKQIAPSAGDFTLNLTAANGALSMQLFDARAGEILQVSQGLKWRLTYSLKKKEKGWCKKAEAVENKTVEITRNGDSFSLGNSVNIGSGEIFTVDNIFVERLETTYFQGRTNLGSKSIKP